jgi:uncharacterized membrane protein YoaK (UPF0700 family)
VQRQRSSIALLRFSQGRYLVPGVRGQDRSTGAVPGCYQCRTRAERRLARLQCAPSDLVLVRVTQWTADRQHGPLPLLLVCLTVVTGLVDAFSYLRLGHVFVANMTGNVVFLGFALAGVGEISIVASLLAIVAFALGAALGGRWAAGRALHRGHLLAAATSVQAGTVLVASVIASTAGVEGPTVRLTLIGLLALAMGGQNAVVRRLAVPDLTTTVLTLTVTGLVADSTAPSVRGRRLISVLAMLAGALTGGILLRWVTLAAPLWSALVLLVACASGAYLAAGRPQSQTWQ